MLIIHNNNLRENVVKEMDRGFVCTIYLMFIFAVLTLFKKLIFIPISMKK